MARKRLGEILLQTGVLDEERLRVALREQQRWGGQLGRILIDHRLVREEDLVRALSIQLATPVANLRGKNPPKEVLELLPVEYCEEHSLIPMHREGKFLDLALCDPGNVGILDDVRIRTQLNVRPYIIGPKMLEQAIQNAYRGGPVPVAPPRPVGLPDASGGLHYVELESKVPTTRAVGPSAPSAAPHDPEAFEQLQKRVTQLEALLERDEAVLRKLLGLLVDQQVVSREQILACLQI